MKNLIIVAMVLSMTLMSGCGSREEEMILFNDSITAEDINANSTETTYEMKSANDNDNESKALEDDPKLSFVVFVCGAVNRPGVYEVNQDARVFDVIEKAEGYRGDAAFSYLNLAESISDGQKIYVPTLYEVESGNLSASGAMNSINNGNSGSGSSSGNAEAVGGLVNINKATEDELRTLPGVGESKAKAIIAYREENGGFRKIEDIMEISGIKTNLFNKVKDRICVD